VVVISSAIKKGNPELAAARSRGLPGVRRAEMLAEIMRFKNAIAIAGTHGKTTTTTLVATLLDAGGVDPTVINGGIINAYGTNARLGAGDWMVVEADESDGTFVKLPATIAVVTNIDPEHLDFWGDFAALKAGFRAFIETIPFYGFAVLCLDDPVVQELAAEIEDRRIIAYGANPQAKVRLLDLAMTPAGAGFSVAIEDDEGGVEIIEDLKLPMIGTHNVQNALAAIATARRLGVGWDAVRDGLAGFAGVGRRFTRVGEVGGVLIIDDYGHHPTEIAAVLAAAREVSNGKVIAVVQPHRYTRLRDLFGEFRRCFNDADAVFVAEVYPAGEAPIEGADRDALVEGLRRSGHRRAAAIEGPADLPALVAAEAEPGDVVVFLGAGDITHWAHAFPDELAPLLTTAAARA
ncbi:MAG: UDP-N-acetylmuramate--L-alanine ligase, partial [Caulobacteraceae bacterium]